MTSERWYAPGRSLGQEQSVGVQPSLKVARGFSPEGDSTGEARQSWSGSAWQTVGTTERAFDGLGQVTGVTHRDGAGATLAGYAYGYDVADRLTSETIDGVTRGYGYDAADQLTSDNGTGLTYDPNGNRTGAGIVTGPGNRLLSDGTWNYTYDAAGNLTKKSQGPNAETWTYAYDHEDRLVSASRAPTDGAPADATVAYAYDAFGNRLKRDEWSASGGADFGRFGYDGWDTAKPPAVGGEGFDAWADLDGSGSLTMRRLYGAGFDDLVAGQDGSGNARWYLADRLGSVRQVADGAGAVVGTRDYGAFGQLLGGSGVEDRYGYTGREWDAALGLQYTRARMYDPVTGRFTSADPAGFAAGDPNLYRYVGNSPTNATDPSGLEELRVRGPASKLLNEERWDRIRRMWDALSPRAQAKLNARLNGPGMLERMGGPGTMLGDPTTAWNLIRERDEVVAAWQVTYLDDLAQGWEADLARQKAQPAPPRQLTNLDVLRHVAGNLVGYYRGTVEAGARSVAAVQWATGAGDNELTRSIEADRQGYQARGDSSAWSGLKAFASNFMFTEVAFMAWELKTAESRRGSDYGRPLDSAEQGQRLLGVPLAAAATAGGGILAYRGGRAALRKIGAACDKLFAIGLDHLRYPDPEGLGAGNLRARPSEWDPRPGRDIPGRETSGKGIGVHPFDPDIPRISVQERVWRMTDPSAFRYELNPKHQQKRAGVSPEPTNPRQVLRNHSVWLDAKSTDRRVGVDPRTGEYVVFDQTRIDAQGHRVYHSHART